MPALSSIVAQGEPVEAHRPWPRVAISADAWTAAAHELANGRATLLGLWGEWDASRAVHMALIGEDTSKIAVVSLACPQSEFPSVGALHAPAIRLERALHSLYGLRPIGIPDSRPWFDLGFWDVQRREPSSNPRRTCSCGHY